MTCSLLLTAATAGCTAPAQLNTSRPPSVPEECHPFETLTEYEEMILDRLVGRVVTDQYGLLVKDEKEPIPGAKIFITAKTDSDRANSNELALSTRSDVDGKFWFEKQIPLGSYWVLVCLRGWDPVSVPVKLVPDTKAEAEVGQLVITLNPS